MSLVDGGNRRVDREVGHHTMKSRRDAPWVKLTWFGFGTGRGHLSEFHAWFGCFEEKTLGLSVSEFVGAKAAGLLCTDFCLPNEEEPQ